MREPRIVHLRSAEALRDAAERWDDLWWRSEISRPTVRAEMVASWVEQFAHDGQLHVIAVEQHGTWMAAIPLVQRRRRFLSTAELTSNEWSPNGDLLLDPKADVPAVLDTLVGHWRYQPWQWLWLDDISLDTPRWLAVRAALERAGIGFSWHAHTSVGVIEIGNDFEEFKNSLRKKHRKKLLRSNPLARGHGASSTQIFTELDPEDVEHRIRTAFEIEDRSWKGGAGTSVLRTPGMLRFFSRQARSLAAWGQLELAFLYCDCIPVAFSYSAKAKGVTHWHKIGYDPCYASLSPGQILQWQLFQSYFEQPQHRAVDTMGPLDRSLAEWNPSVVQNGRLVIAPRLPLGRSMLAAEKQLHSLLK